jgi:heptosyltransferase-3
VPHAGYRLDYRMTAAEAQWAEQRLRAARAAQPGPLVGLQIASFPTKAYRDWPQAHFLEFARRARSRWPSAHFLLFGGPGDQSRTGWLAAQLDGGCTNLAGTLTLRQSAALMSRLDLYVGVDTGPTHLASCFDIPLVGLYHCYSPSRLIGALDHPRFYPVDHPRPHGCAVETPMAEISVETVFASAERALREHPPAA